MTTKSACARLLLLILVIGLVIPVAAGQEQTDRAAAAATSEVVIQTDEAGTSLALPGGGQFRQTRSTVIDAQLIDVPGSSVRLVAWREVSESGASTPFYAISPDGQHVAVVKETSYELKLLHGDFDPLLAPPLVPGGLMSGESDNVYVVQFVTQPLDEFRANIRQLGGTLYKFLANHAYIVRMSPEVRQQVAALPFVRWVGPLHPAYKLAPEILDQMRSNEPTLPRRYSVMLFERGPAAQERIAAQIKAFGGEVHGGVPEGFRLEATMSLQQVRQVARLDDVQFIDPKGETQVDMDIVRQIGGANYVETVAGYTGQGVRAEAADTELDVTHPEWSAPPIIHRAGSDVLHGTSVYGILFAQGLTPQARGLIPSATGIFACSTNGLLGGGPTRYQHTAELVDPNGPYRTVLQTNSTGDPQITYYSSISAEMDDMLLLYDIVLTQSQSNTGNQNSRPQAWAKNIISCGAINHYNTLSKADDCWCGNASIGPASDGRIKPDLCFFYDLTYTTTSGGGYTQFGGTSGATPSVAGHVGLFFQMWSEGIFGNEVIPGGTVFDNRCHMTTAKAVMVNTADPYPFTGTGHDLTRTHQGWGMPDLAYLYDTRANISVLDETEVLANLQTAEYVAFVEPGEPELRITMVYADTAGVPNSSVHRINDLTLKVTSPGGTIYWGNNGLATGNWSTSGGVANTLDTVENVFVQNPESGIWSVQIIASEVNEDTHVETPEVDADFALVVSGAFLATCTSQGRINLDSAYYACEDSAAIRVVDCDLNADDQVVETTTVTISSTSEPAGEAVLLTETGPQTSDFRGTIMLSATNAAAVLQVSGGDVVTATYNDADDGTGQPAVVTDTADVDCTAPIISNVLVADVQPFDALVTFDTNEPTAGSVRYGTSCGQLTGTASQSGFGTTHSVILSGLSENTTYFFAVDAVDQADNSATDDNGGSCYTFSTPDIPNYFTELFASNDLDNVSLIFTPNGSGDFYAACAEPITSLPTDPTGGTTLSLSDDSNVQVTIGSGETAKLYGTSYGTFFVGSNGYITFNTGDTDYTETIEDHFNRPRLSACFDDLNPSAGGTVSWKQLADRVAVTYLNVAEYGTSNQNTFQIEMFFDGQLVISYLGVAVADGLAGLSGGGGVPQGFFQTDLSAMGTCGPKPPTAENGSASTPLNTPVLVTLSATDDGLPNPPAALSYVIASLPANGSLSDPNGGAIGGIPYTLLAGGNQVTYTPAFGSLNPDSFQFKANDGGTPPEGGDSNTATVSITITPPLPQQVYFFPLDTNPGWSTEGSWAWGDPTGGGTHNHDPQTGYTGNNVYGYNLSGDYTNNMPVRYLTTTALDCAELVDTELRFRRWLGVESSAFDHANLEVSSNGTTWTTVWDHSGGTIAETSWSYQTYDISAVADGASAVYLRWGMGPTDGGTTYPGWNIDDIEIWARVIPQAPVCANALGDMDGLNGVDGEDIDEFTACYIGDDVAVTGCVCADMNVSGGFEPSDVTDFVNCLLGISCP